MEIFLKASFHCSVFSAQIGAIISPCEIIAEIIASTKLSVKIFRQFREMYDNNLSDGFRNLPLRVCTYMRYNLITSIVIHHIAPRDIPPRRRASACFAG
jgi:hypothetical protein